MNSIPIVLLPNIDMHMYAYPEDVLEYFIDKIPLLNEFMKQTINEKFFGRFLEVFFVHLETGQYESRAMNEMLKQHKNMSKEELLVKLKKDVLEIEKKLPTYIEEYWDKNLKYLNYSLKDIPDEIKMNKKIVKKCLKVSPKNLFYADDSIKDDDDIIKWIYNYSKIEKCYKSISPRLKEIREYAFKAIEGTWKNYIYLPENLKKDKELVLHMYKHHPYNVNLKTARRIPKEILMDKEFVKQLVNAYSFEYSVLPYEIKEDREILMKAVGIKGYRLIEVDRRFQKDLELILEAFKSSSISLMGMLDNQIRDNYEIMLKIMHVSPGSFGQLKTEFKNEETFTLFLQSNAYKSRYNTIPNHLIRNSDLFKKGLEYHYSNIILFSCEVEGFIEGVIFHFEKYLLAQLQCPVVSYLTDYFNSYTLNDETIDYFRRKIYLYSEMYLPKRKSQYEQMIPLRDIVFDQNEIEGLTKYAMILRRIYFKLLFDQKISGLKDIHFVFQ